MLLTSLYGQESIVGDERNIYEVAKGKQQGNTRALMLANVSCLLAWLEVASC